MPSPAVTVSLLVNGLPNKIAPNVPNNLPRNRPFYSFASLLIVLLRFLIKKRDSSSDLIIFMIPFIS